MDGRASVYALKVTEYRPIARWGEDGLVTAEGEVFRPKGETFPTTLARLSGDDAEYGNGKSSA